MTDKERSLRMSDFDLQKKFPGYFNKWVFRSGVSIIVLLFVAMLITNGGYRFTYAECLEDECKNPFYMCKDDFEEDCISEDYATFKDLGEKKYLHFGEVVGNKPNFLAKNFNLMSFIIVLLSFWLNHLLYLIRRSKNGSKPKPTKH